MHLPTHHPLLAPSRVVGIQKADPAALGPLSFDKLRMSGRLWGRLHRETAPLLSAVSPMLCWNCLRVPDRPEATAPVVPATRGHLILAKGLPAHKKDRPLLGSVSSFAPRMPDDRLRHLTTATPPPSSGSARPFARRPLFNYDVTLLSPTPVVKRFHP